MLGVTVLAVGKCRDRYYADACAEYAKRLGFFCRLTIHEVEEGRLPQDPSDAEIARCLQEEARALKGKIPKGAYLVPLCIEGQQISSLQLARQIESAACGYSSIAFLIGGSHGLAQELKEQADFLLSMSRMTFPHQLARVMLLEQVYRAFTITGNRKYHK